MSNSYIFKYKCRMCGLIFDGEGGYLRDDADRFMRYMIERLMTHQGPGLTGLLQIHHCENGNSGIADLQGTELDRA